MPTIVVPFLWLSPEIAVITNMGAPIALLGPHRGETRPQHGPESERDREHG